MSLDANGLSEETRRRLGEFEFVVPEGVTADTDVFDPSFKSIQPVGEPQASPLPGSKKPGYSHVWRNVRAQTALVSGFHPAVRTFYDVFATAAAAFPERDCVGERIYDTKTKQWSKYQWQSFSHIAHRRTQFAAGLVKAVKDHTGISSGDQKYIVSVYAPNSINWIVADLACQTQGLPSVCLYDTLGPDTSEYILNFCESPVVVASLANVPKVLHLKSKLPNLKVIIVTNPLTANHFEAPGHSKKDLLAAWASDMGVALYSCDEIEDLGRKHPIADSPPSPKDTYAINFTSGTTGNPKGAIITHETVVASITMSRVSTQVDQSKQATVFSFLPLAHIYERMSMCFVMSLGHRQAFPHGAVTELLDDIFVLKPTNCNMVPRVLNRIAAALKASTIEAPGIAGAISRKAFAAKRANLRATGACTHPFWDKVWSRKIRAKLGFDNMQFITSGSAPLAKDAIEFLKCALGVEIMQGYGLTESLSGICVTQPGENVAGGCGAIAVTCEVRLRDVPELGYTANDQPQPRGEVMLRGPQIYRGYYKNDEKTLESFDEDGWFHTGDVGTIDSVGRIFIIDRVKNFFKLAQGEYVAAEKIENVYLAKSSLLNQIFVHGNSHETFLVAIVGVNPDSYAPFVSKVLRKPFTTGDMRALEKTLHDPTVKAAFLRALNKSVGPKMLQGFERVKNACLYFDPLTVENETLTPTMKIKRPTAVKYFQAEIEAMYKEGALDVYKHSKL
jgi:long-chain acyl-CoA synthetase